MVKFMSETLGAYVHLHFQDVGIVNLFLDTISY